MAGDPIYDTSYTGFSVTPTQGTTYATSTDTAYYGEEDRWATTSYISYAYTEYEGESEKEIKERNRLEAVLLMKKMWSKDVKQLIVKPVRPSIQLMGVSFNGRGWA